MQASPLAVGVDCGRRRVCGQTAMHSMSEEAITPQVHNRAAAKRQQGDSRETTEGSYRGMEAERQIEKGKKGQAARETHHWCCWRI